VTCSQNLASWHWGQLIGEFNGSTRSRLKEYIYGVDGLLARIEPTTGNSNGTRLYNLGPSRLASSVINSGASVISRHDYMPFGEELGAGAAESAASENAHVKMTP